MWVENIPNYVNTKVWLYPEDGYEEQCYWSSTDFSKSEKCDIIYNYLV
jgi:hypothetical protein